MGDVPSSDTTRLSYSSNWQPVPGKQGKTVHYTTTGNDEAIVRLSFKGVGIIALGTVTGSSPTTYTLDTNATQSSDVVPGPQKLLDVEGIPCDNHQLALILPEFDPNNPGHAQTQIILHKFVITPCPSDSSTTPDSGFTFSSSPTLGLPSSSTSATVPPPSSAALEGASTRTVVSPGQIAGIVIGCLLFVLLILGFGIFFIRRRRRQKQQARPSAEFLTHVSAMPEFMRPPELPPINEKGPPIMPAARNRNTASARISGAPMRNSSATDNVELSSAQPMPVEYVRGYLPDSKDWLRQQEARGEAAMREREWEVDPSPAYREAVGGESSGDVNVDGDRERERERRRRKKRSRRPRETRELMSG
ncbi:uncharacterized protein STEHIDRAFT_145753 [Stereum hirsutum FP-91666 SS1]|uniref:uncharacterized protein n=1 Tax=Stereum hirsutum (strain FP-91666) TaxID=721885 RepID=UPI0004409F5E|nr:uncharacterized protein STEHIDRAFT_145753 [Stereum hirsutum FP-91666 SS1]EIM88963.1 hypothetical protein STEHIDRAFT_145753 [Stereum hirsutum FP-91666 SS1]